MNNPRQKANAGGESGEEVKGGGTEHEHLVSTYFTTLRTKIIQTSTNVRANLALQAAGLWDGVRHGSRGPQERGHLDRADVSRTLHRGLQSKRAEFPVYTVYIQIGKF